MYRVIGICRGLNNPRGGAQSQVMDWYENVRKNSGGTFHIDIPKEPTSLFRRFFVLSQTAPGFIEWFYRSSRLLKQQFHHENYDLAHIHCYGGYWTFPLNPTKTIVTLYDEPTQTFRDNVSPLYSRLIQNHLDGFTSLLRNKVLSSHPWIQAPSNSVKKQLIEIGFDKSRIRVIPYGFLPHVQTNPGLSKEEVLDEVGLSEQDKYVMVVGTIDFRKGIHRILEACKILKDTNPNVHLILAGRIENIIQKSFAGVLIQNKKKFNLKNFHLTGYLPRNLLDGLLWNCNAYLCASYSETGPLSLMEAARFGVPIISTDVGAAKDFLDTEATILARDCSPSEIAEAISESIDRSRKRYSCISKFSKEKVTSQLIDFYHHIHECT